MFNQQVIDSAKAHAIAQYPKESCGLVVNDQYVPCENIADKPEEDFKISPEVTDPLVQAGTLQAIIHSHPSKGMKEISSPSEQDMITQVAFNVPCGIIDLDEEACRDPYWWGDFLLDEPLLGQEFHHGIRDCYSLCRKYYWQKHGIKIPEFPRGDRWWMKDIDMYVDGFQKAGFKQISKEELQDGDAMLGKVNSTKINHAGIYLDNKEDGKGLVLHHLYKRLSRREPASRWAVRAELFVRYVGAS